MQDSASVNESLLKFLEDSLRQTQELLAVIRAGQNWERMFEDSADAVSIHNGTGQIMFSNAQFQSWFSPTSASVGRTEISVVSEERGVVTRLMDRLVTPQSPYALVSHRAHDAQDRWGEFLTFKHSLHEAEHPSLVQITITRLRQWLDPVANEERRTMVGHWDRFRALGENDRLLAKFLAQGLSPREIATIVKVSPRQVELRRRHILNAMRLSSPTQLTILLVRLQDRGFMDFGL